MFSNIYHLTRSVFHTRVLPGLDDSQRTSSSDLNNAVLLSGGVQGLCQLKCYKPARAERFTKSPVEAMSRCDAQTRFSKRQQHEIRMLEMNFRSSLLSCFTPLTWCAVSFLLSTSYLCVKDRCRLSEFPAETAVLNKQITIKGTFHRQLHEGSSSMEFCFNMSLNLLLRLPLDHMVYSLLRVKKCDWQSDFQDKKNERE